MTFSSGSGSLLLVDAVVPEEFMSDDLVLGRWSIAKRIGDALLLVDGGGGNLRIELVELVSSQLKLKDGRHQAATPGTSGGLTAPRYPGPPGDLCVAKAVDGGQ